MTDAYTVLAGWYDRLTADVDYEKWADYVERHFRRLKRPVRSVAELGCGTGSLTRLLARRGYAVTAIDLSPDMLAVADQKCEGLGVLFLCQDMSRLTLLEPADAVVSCLDSVNYVTRPAAVQRTFRRVWEALRPGGLFLFDIRTPEMLRSMDGQVCLDETEDVYCVWRGAFSRKRKLLTYEMDLFFADPHGAWRREGEVHEEYAYEPAELAQWLGEAGFEKIRQYGELVFRAPKPGEERVFFAARRPENAG